MNNFLLSTSTVRCVTLNFISDGCLCLFFFFVNRCMVQTTQWSPAVHWGEFCLITLANYQSYTCFSLLSGMLLVSGRLVSQHMFIVNIIFTPQLPGIIFKPVEEDNDFILIIKVIAEWFTFKFPYLLCTQLKLFVFFPVCTCWLCLTPLVKCAQ